MGYVIALAVFVVLVPLLFMILTRRSAGAGRGGQRDRGLTVDQPSSDEPTPGAAGSINQPKAGAERRIPPG